MKKALVFTIASLLSFFAFSQEDEALRSEEDELAKELLNPIANLVSLPFQSNFDFGMGPADGSRWLMNVQPVIPMSIGEDWNLIGRVILPVISQNDIFGESGSQTGLGDVVLSSFFSPKEPTSGGLIWGAGPVFLIPTATDNLLGAGQFGVGPTAVALKQAGSFTIGALVNHIWSVAGNSDRSDVNATFFQPFLARNFPGGYALSLNTELSHDWGLNATLGSLHLIGSKVFAIGDQLTQVFIGPRIPYGNANSASWGFRAGLTLMFPK
ncbi:hypothetical protein [Robiginitalea aurantiaca]|uniref:Transporter n=1 Tax=Robiginitalea aurantiaca TaxID=3056915 RepID=A0ABT7WDL3_9FLAO|nr:hypothetical protein [Robiginitalea aurantiaca]MDM9631007.1 hypothetical protein [Robiginitalea aurantiaca]